MIAATPIRADLPPSRMLVQLSEPVSYIQYIKQAGNEDGDKPYLQQRCSTRYAVVSIAKEVFGPETAVFPADEHGEILQFVELSGINVADFGVAIRAAGWKLVS